MAILLTDTIAPNNTTFKIVLGKDVGGAITGSFVSSSGTIQGPTGSFEHVSSSGGLFANLVDNSGGTLKTVIFDNATGQLFTTTSTAAGTPSLEAVSQVSPFKLFTNTVMTASNGGSSGIWVNDLYNGSGYGRLIFETSSDYNNSVLGLGTITTADGTAFSDGLIFSGGNAQYGPVINAQGSFSQVGGLTIKNNSYNVANFAASSYHFTVYSGSAGYLSTYGNIRSNKLRTETVVVPHIVLKELQYADTGPAEEILYKTRISQTGSTTADQYIELSGSGVIIQPTSSLPPAVAGAIVYSGSEFYIAVP